MFEVKSTHLERENSNVKETLEYKLEEARQKNLPIEETLSDYIALGVNNIDLKIKQLEAYKSDILDAIKTLKEHKEEIKQEVSTYMLEDLGIDKLKGIAVSSITVKAKDVSISKKFVLDEDKDELVKLGYAHWEEEIKEIPQTIKINNKRSKNEK